MTGTLEVFVSNEGLVGHAFIGFNNGTGATQYLGYHSSSASNYIGRLSGPGQVQDDAHIFSDAAGNPFVRVYSGSQTFTLNSSQVTAVQNYINGITSSPGTYNFLTNNCAVFVNGAMSAGGVGTTIGGTFADNQLFGAGDVGLYISSQYGDGGLNPWYQTVIAENLFTAVGSYAHTLLSPIALDLNGDGLHYTDLASSSIHFDIDNDHFAEHVEWLDTHDGFLVRDSNSNGQIDNVTEMFGDNGGTTAYAKLAALDSNSDGKLSSADTAWSSLKVWVDANSNGAVDSGELKTLSSLNIASINVAPVNDTSLAGHAVAGDTVFTYTNSTTGQAADVLLETDQVDSWYIGDGTGGSTAIDADTTFLPASRGYGILPDLAHAMTQDATLKGLVQDFASLDISTHMHEVYDQVENIILQWAGAGSVDPSGAGPNVDGRHLAVLESVNDLSYQYLYTGSSDVPSYYGDDIGKDYAFFSNEILTRLLVQGPLQGVFANANYDFLNDTLHLNDTVSAITTRAQSLAPTSADDKTTFWNEIARVLTEHHDELGVTDVAAKAAVDTAAGFLTHIVTVTGTTGDDFLNASGPGATYADGTSDTFMGGAGDDLIGTGMGDDLVIFRGESGADTVENGLGYDAILLQSATPSQVAFSVSGDDMVLTVSSLSETITVQNQFETASFGRTHDHDISEIQFSNGVIWDQATFESVAHGGSAPTPLTGTSGNDTLTAGASDINLSGLAGADTFKITQASSTFVTLTDFNFAQGDRIDIGSFDGIHTLSDLAITDIAGHASFALHGPNGDITVNLSGLSSGQVTQDFFLGNDLNYGTGTTVTGTSAAENLSGSAGNDTIYANEGGDTVQGNFGGDVIYGWTGDDSLSGGYGHDTISADDGNDQVYGNSGNDSIYGGLGTDSIYGGDGADILGGDAGNDTIYGGDGNDSAYGSDDVDSIFGDAGNDYLAGELGNDALNGGDGNDVVTGGAGADTLDGGNGNDTTDYQSSASAINVDLSLGTAQSGGDAQGDVLSNFENVNGSTGNDTISGSSTDNYLRGFAGADNIHGSGGNDTIDGGAGVDTLDGGSGTDTVDYQASSAAVNVDLSLSTAQSGGDAQGDVLSTIENLNGSALGDTLSGDGNANYIRGFAGADNIHGSGGNDTIDGGAGADTLDGGTGTNLVDYEYSSAAVVVNLALATAQSGGDAQGDVLSNFSNLNGSIYGDTLTGNSSANSIQGLSGDDIVSGGAGADTLDGGDGLADTADYQSSAAAVNVNLTLATGQSGGDAQGDFLSNFENISGSALNDTLTGDDGNNLLRGLAGIDSINGGNGDDTIDGGAGADTLNGGAGSNTLSYEASSAAITLNLATGTHTGGDAQGDSISNFYIINGSGYGDQFVGDSGDNYFNAMAGNDTVDGGAGADTLDGGSGTDTIDYQASSAAVNVLLGLPTEQSGGAAQGDILSGFENINGSAYADTLSGDSAANYLRGFAGADDIHGNGGNDTLDGGAGADTLNGGDGTNWVDYQYSSAAVNVSLALSTAQSGGDAAGDILVHISDVLGSAYGDTVYGDSGANSLDGGGGDDLLVADLGADTINGGTGHNLLDYELSSSAVTVNLLTNSNSGGYAASDSISNIQVLYGSGYADSLTADNSGIYIRGLAGTDSITGGSGNDTLDGGAGADILNGGSGIDLVDYEYSSAGVNVNLTLATGQSGGDAGNDTLSGFENIYASGYSDTLTGDSAANYIRGFAGTDSISGGDGNDVLDGGAGADTLNGGNGTDYVDYEYSSAGVNVSLALATAQSGGDAQGDILSNFESVYGSGLADTIIGDAGANTIYGLGGNDIILGQAGADTLDGGAGIDYVDYEYSSAGVNVNLTLATAQSGGDAQYDILSNFEYVYGSAYADTIIGDAGDNYLRGFAGADSITAGGGTDFVDGSAGADTLDGGTGNDYVDYEYSSAAVNVDLSLGTGQSGGDAQGDILSNFENLYGSGYSDTLIGNSGANLLQGFASNDTITGGGGADTIYGGTGNDTFAYAASSGVDTIADFEGAGAAGGDVIQIASGIYANYTALSSHITYSASNAVIDLGSGNSITVVGANTTTHFVSGDFTFV